MPSNPECRPWVAAWVAALAVATGLHAQPRPLPPITDEPARLILKVAPPIADRLPPPRKADPPIKEEAGVDKKADKRDSPALTPPGFPEGLSDAVPVTLPDVLRLAVVANLDIAQARLAVERARVGILRAGARYLPNFALGSSYVTHEGTIQNTLGNIAVVNRDSLFVGLGSAVSFNITDAIFALPEARSLLLAARFGQTRVQNDTLLRVADAYFAVLRARRQLARLDETLEFLTSDEESELRGKSKGLLPLISSFVKAGNALPSDQARVEADVVRRMAERAYALEAVRVAAAELSRLLHLSAATLLLPMDDVRWPLPIPGGQWHGRPLEELVAEALRGRPELAENSALIQAATRRYQAARWRPLVPTMFGSISHGGFGGGPAIVRRTASGGNVFGSSGTIADFGPRTDIEIGLQWRLDGLGLGNYAAIRDSRLTVDSARITQLQLQDLVVSQVVQSDESIRRSRQRLQIIRPSLYDEQNRPRGTVYNSLRLNFIRIKGGQGLPLEALDSTRRLSDVLSLYADSLTDYDRSRFRLLISMGQTGTALEGVAP